MAVSLSNWFAFRNLSTSKKLSLLCSTFVIALGVAIYGLIAEKKISIEFARKELVGTRYLDTVRGIYAAILAGRESPSSVQRTAYALSADEILRSLSTAEAHSKGRLETEDLQLALSSALQGLWSGIANQADEDARFLAALAAARRLALRIGDNSNLTLDPDLDTYYLQDSVVTKLPTILNYLGEVRTLFAKATSTAEIIDERRVRLLILDGLLRSTMEALTANLVAASRRDPMLGPKQTVGPDVDAMIATTRLYFSVLSADPAGGQVHAIAVEGADNYYSAATQQALAAWAALQFELERLLKARIDNLFDKLYRSLLVIGVLACLSIAIALMTHWYIVRPLESLETVAREVRQTRDYFLRVDYAAQDEIGRLSGAFNDMMSELAAAREREAADEARVSAMQAELARTARLTTMGQIAASIAHEINQPLAAIVASGNAGLRWLSNPVPNLDESRAVLKRIVADGHRAGKVINGIRAMFKDEGGVRADLAINDLIEEVLALLHRDLTHKKVVVHTELGTGLPKIPVDRVQLQQVLVNLILNGAEAMASVTDRPRLLQITSSRSDDGVLVTVADSGTGIDPQHRDRIFEAFFTTKSQGMGMGLSICRSIVQSHGGRLWTSPRAPHGSVFSMTLPIISSES
jgi:signal transduction histidine kinase